MVDIYKYLDRLNNKLNQENMKHQCYLVKNKKDIKLIEFDNSKVELNKKINKYIKDIILQEKQNNIDVSYLFAFINYAIQKKLIGKHSKFGVMSLNCSLININKIGELSKKNILSNTIYYSEKNIIERGVKSQDYKKLILGLINSKIQNNPMKIIFVNQL